MKGHNIETKVESFHPKKVSGELDHEANTSNDSSGGGQAASSAIVGTMGSGPQYVTITVDGEGGIRSENSGNSTYVTYIDNSADTPIYATATAAVASNGQTISLHGAGSQFFGSNAGGVAFAQGKENGSDDLIVGRQTTATTILAAAGDFNIITSCGRNGADVVSSTCPMSTSDCNDSLISTHSAETDATPGPNNSSLLDGSVFMVPNSSNGSSNDGNSSEVDYKPVVPSPRIPKVTNKFKGSDYRALMQSANALFENRFEDQLELQQKHGSSRSSKQMKLFPLNGQGIAHTPGGGTIQAFPVTVQWLMENYETAEGVSLPRSTLYNHYLRHCVEHKLDPVNAASFGKLIRSVFLGLRTRRLGTRGNSKYHYYGIRLKPGSALNNLIDENVSINGPITNGHRSNGLQSIIRNRYRSHAIEAGIAAKRMKIMKGETYDSGHFSGLYAADHSILNFLGDTSQCLSNFPDLKIPTVVPEGVSKEDLAIFHSLYKIQFESILEIIGTFQLGKIEACWKELWDPREEAENPSEGLPKSKMITICEIAEVQEFIVDADYKFYQAVSVVLIPDVLKPIPSTMTQGIRNFAKNLETWLLHVMSDYPEDIVKLKINILGSLAQTLRRYTSLNHLAQAARAVLQNQTQISQMLSDLNRVDFSNVQEQALWVCGCEGEAVPRIEYDFKITLANQVTLEEWASWLDNVIENFLRPYERTKNYIKMARLFLLKWSFYCSLVIRDLTLRSAASFGSFHLLRLLYDEYIFYLVEHRVAKVTGEVPIAVIGKQKFSDNHRLVFPSIPTASGPGADEKMLDEEEEEEDDDDMPLNGDPTDTSDIKPPLLVEAPESVSRTEQDEEKPITRPRNNFIAHVSSSSSGDT